MSEYVHDILVIGEGRFKRIIGAMCPNCRECKRKGEDEVLTI